MALVDGEDVVGGIHDIGAEVGCPPDQPRVVAGPADREGRELDEEPACEHEVVDPVCRLPLTLDLRASGECHCPTVAEVERASWSRSVRRPTRYADRG